MQPTDDQSATGQATDRRVTVQEAAALLGLSEDAVRSRLKRGTLRKEKAPDGAVLVVLGGDGRTDRPPTGRATDQHAAAELVEALYDHVEHLRGQLEAEREANRENRRIIAGLVQRVPELQPATEPREAHESATEGPDGDKVPKGEGRPSWWRRFFGF